MIIKFKDIETVKAFVNLTSTLNDKIEVKNDRYIIDGKSIMGLFSLNFNNDLEVITYNDEDKNKIEEFIKENI